MIAPRRSWAVQVRPGRARPRALAVAALALSWLALTPASAADEPPAVEEDAAAEKELGALDIEALMSIKVVSVSKRPESFATTPAAIHVITSEDIRRSGATSLPDALRMAPGIQVMRTESSAWTVASRGLFTSIINANDVLALVDGRSLYSTSVNGRVVWSENDVLLEDVERIEVIRGPGGSLWGANAVNGVINVVTKRASETQGIYATAGGGTPVEQGFGAARYGGKISEDAHFRTYVKYQNRGSFETPEGQGAHDHWWMVQAGGRLDWTPTGEDLITLSGDAYASELASATRIIDVDPPFSETRVGERDQAGGNVMARWTRDLGDDSELTIQGWAGITDHRDDPAPLFAYREATFDLDAQHRLRLFERHELTYGLGWRLVRDIVDRRGLIFVSASPSGDAKQIASAFVQDKITIIEDSVFLTLGSKVEYNEFTGFEVQPAVRLAWHPAEGYTVWGAVSRGVVIPPRVSGVEGRLNVDAGPSTIVALQGADRPRGQDLLAYEVGVRLRPLEPLFVDVSGFIHRHDSRQTTVQGVPGPDPDFPGSTLVPLLDTFDYRGQSMGFEVSGRFDATDWWRFYASYSFLTTDLRIRAGSLALDGDEDEGNSPENQAQVRTSFDIPGDLELDLWLRYVDHLATPDVPSYVELDARIAWRPVERVELSVVGQNLLHESHLEGRSTGGIDKEVPRGVYGAITLRF